ncbi:MAG: ABC transporter substrate-binding protein [Rhodospirillaceae bacterium]|jgi:NitT/TauT family transport system substrate-binding protein|nr:ABC transporter substrate-binding protein [Rhodospirillaceae bacterium]
MRRPSKLIKKIGLPVAAAVAGLLTISPVSAKEKVTYAYLADPALEGVMYAIKTGKVKSDKITIETNALQIPALISSTPAKKYDVIMNAVMAIPFAKRRGLELIVLSSALRSAKGRLGAGIWVKKDSPYKTMADLKGKKIGSYSLRATGTTWIRIALAKKYKVNVSYKGGDFSWVQIPAPALLSALETGRVAAATLIHAQAYSARKTGNYRVLAWTNKDLNDMYKLDSLSAVNVTYPEKLKARPEAFKEFNRMMHESVKYAVAHADEVGAAIAKKTAKIDAGYFKAWINDYSYFPAAVSDEDKKAMTLVWTVSKEMGILKKVPDVNKSIWKHAITE